MENRLLYRCPVCNMPMLEKIGLKVFLLQFYKGQRVKTEIERDLSSPQSEIRIRCGACKKGAHIFAHINEIVKTEESFVIHKESVDSIKG